MVRKGTKTKAMRNLYLIIGSLLLLSACSKSGIQPAKVYSNTNGTYIDLSTIKWYVTKNGSFANLNLKISGKTNGDSMTLRTSGDGLITQVPIALQSGKMFTEDAGIYFIHEAPAAGTLRGTTQITVYRGPDKFVVNLDSGDVSY
jgi:hypothetical protein